MYKWSHVTCTGYIVSVMSKVKQGKQGYVHAPEVVCGWYAERERRESFNIRVSQPSWADWMKQNSRCQNLTQILRICHIDIWHISWYRLMFVPATYKD